MSQEHQNQERQGLPPPPGTPSEPTVTSEDLVLPASGPPTHKQIGPYQIKRVIASGGMGTVYEAVQEHPRRTVAVKLMRAGIASRSALRRFEYESQILARLRHPGIAQIYEAGTFDDGGGLVPYFAMEYIPNARTITEFIKLKKLNLRRQLELFAHACDAVHHGHQKGIIHRDLKPANVLVDSHGEVKIIDFGVARGTDSDLAVVTLQTDIGQLIGTLQYMSPEQCDADPHDIDIRSDVYALGVVLYEMLTGKLPYPVSSRTLAESTRVIREQPPTKLSTLDHALKGDIETMVFKALEKERDRRYQSASELAQDIRRYLAGEAIVARRASIAYQLRVFVRRNKGLAASLASIFTLLVAGVLISSTLYVRAERERDRAASAEAKATAVNEFLLEDMLTLSDPEKAQGRILTVREALDAAASRVSGALAKQPALSASIRKTIGRTYLNLGLYAEAEPHLSAASAVLSALLGEDHPDTLDAQYWQGMLLLNQGRHPEAEVLLRSTLAAQRRVLGNEHVDTLRSQIGLSVVVGHAGRTDEALALSRETLAAARRSLGDEHPQTLRCAGNLASWLGRRGASAECATLAEQTIRVAVRVLGEDHPETLRFKWIRSNCDSRSDGSPGKAPVTAELVETTKRVRGEDHPFTIAVMTDFANALANQGKYAEAEELNRKTLEVSRRVRGEEHADTLVLMTNLGASLSDQGKYAEAEELLQKALDVSRRTLGEDHLNTLTLLSEYGLFLMDKVDRRSEALEISERALRIARRTLSLDRPLMRPILNNRAMALNVNGQPEEAEPLARQAYEGGRKATGDSAPLTLSFRDTLAMSLLGQGKLLEAERIWESVVATQARLYPGDAMLLGEVRANYGRCLSALGKFEAAETELLAAHEVYHPDKLPRHRATRETLEALVDLYTRWGKEDQAANYRALLERLASLQQVEPSKP